ncbi:MAG: S-methyl-5-thioribose-1-phosphate isomerase [Gammaproteobacteria bacterium]|jgi:methylthioribose-1-phosphate isomerase|nr:S-methyl-5-thioribose-1-phosphate isomerase [Gammaproteobacteria bacterium]
MQDSIRAIQWDGDVLKLLDQRLLPHQEIYIEYRDVGAIAEAIQDMVVRGAPAIGITAAYGVVLAAKHHLEKSPDNWRTTIQADLDTLARSRPTAVNLMWAIERMRRVITQASAEPLNDLLREAKRIHEDDIAANKAMGEFGAQLIETPCGVLTHCNTGSLATGGYGTALGVIRSAYAADKITAVYADETRPWLQGARLTAWELAKDQIPVTLIVEGAASHLMKQGKVAWVIVGSDRIAANGDVANKIGTYQLAVSAKYHDVKFMVVAPTSTVDLNIAGGDDIPIEARSPQEVLNISGQAIAANGAQAWNPAFDVTPAALIDAIVTEKGVVLQPTTGKMLAMMEKS